MRTMWIRCSIVLLSLTTAACLTTDGNSAADGGSQSDGGDPPGGDGDGGGDGDSGDGDSTGTGGVSGTGGEPGTKVCIPGGCSGQLCVDADDEPIASTCEWRDEYACYDGAECAVQADGNCGWTATPELTACLGGGGGGNVWWQTCGDPVCGISSDDPAIPNCTDETAGDACTNPDATCETLSCGTLLLCTDADPTGGGVCPISRTKHKRDITYLEPHERQALHDELMSLPLASYHYKRSPQGPRELGFLIDDIEPSPAVRGDRVNLYGYLSMAVAALQQQSAQISALRAEVEELKADGTSRAPRCGP